MMTKTIGRFGLAVSDPATSWIRIHYDSRLLLSLHPEELPDLQFLIDCAQRELQRQERKP